MNKYVSLTRDLIEESGYEVEFGQDGTPHVFSYKKVMANKGDEPVDPVEMKFSTRVGKQKYSTNNKPYLYVQLSLKGRRDQAYALSRVVWAWCHDECPVDMTVDHIDNRHSTPYDNRVANLQLLTHAENLAKRHSPRNQWSFMLTEEQMETYNGLKDRVAGLREQLVSCRKELMDWKAMHRVLLEATFYVRDSADAFYASELYGVDGHGHAKWVEGGMFDYPIWKEIANHIGKWADYIWEIDRYPESSSLLPWLKDYLREIRDGIHGLEEKQRGITNELSKARDEMDSYVRDIREEYYRKNS